MPVCIFQKQKYSVHSPQGENSFPYTEFILLTLQYVNAHTHIHTHTHACTCTLHIISVKYKLALISVVSYYGTTYETELQRGELIFASWEVVCLHHTSFAIARENFLHCNTVYIHCKHNCYIVLHTLSLIHI